MIISAYKINVCMAIFISTSSHHICERGRKKGRVNRIMAVLNRKASRQCACTVLTCSCFSPVRPQNAKRQTEKEKPCLFACIYFYTQQITWIKFYLFLDTFYKADQRKKRTGHAKSYSGKKMFILFSLVLGCGLFLCWLDDVSFPDRKTTQKTTMATKKTIDGTTVNGKIKMYRAQILCIYMWHVEGAQERAREKARNKKQLVWNDVWDGCLWNKWNSLN